jgi:hypothetical protein
MKNDWVFINNTILDIELVREQLLPNHQIFFLLLNIIYQT